MRTVKRRGINLYKVTADRPYRKANDRNFAFAELMKCSGTQFEPKVVDAFISMLKEPD